MHELNMVDLRGGVELWAGEVLEAYLVLMGMPTGDVVAMWCDTLPDTPLCGSNVKPIQGTGDEPVKILGVGDEPAVLVHPGRWYAGHPNGNAVSFYAAFEPASKVWVLWGEPEV